MAEGHWEGCEGGMVHLHELFDRLSVLVQLHRSDAAYLAWHVSWHGMRHMAVMMQMPQTCQRSCHNATKMK